MIRDASEGAFEEPEQGLVGNQPAPELPEDNLLLDLILDNPWVLDNPLDGDVPELPDLPDPDEEAAILIAPVEEEQEEAAIIINRKVVCYECCLFL